MNEMETNNNKKNNNNLSYSLVFGRWPQTQIDKVHLNYHPSTHTRSSTWKIIDMSYIPIQTKPTKPNLTFEVFNQSAGGTKTIWSIVILM